MAEFKAINTQEEFDAAIKDRLARAEAAVRKQYEGYKSPDDVQKELDKYKGFEKQVNDLKAENGKLKVAGWKQAALAKHKLAADYADYLQGEDEKAIDASAEKLAKLAGGSKGSANNAGMSRNTETSGGGSGAGTTAVDAAWAGVVGNMFGD